MNDTDAALLMFWPSALRGFEILRQALPICLPSVYFMSSQVTTPPTVYCKQPKTGGGDSLMGARVYVVSVGEVWVQMNLENCGEENVGWLGGEMTPPMRVAGEGTLVRMDPGAE